MSEFELGVKQFLFDFLNFFGGKGGELNGEQATRLSLDNAVVIEPVQNVIKLRLNAGASKKVGDVFLARCHRHIVGNVVEGIEQQNAFENGISFIAFRFHL